MSIHYFANLGRFVPELILCVTMVGLVVMESTYQKKGDNNRWAFYGILTLGFLLSFFYGVSSLEGPGEMIFSKSYVVDPFSTFVKTIMILATLGCVEIGRRSSELNVASKGEFAILATGC